MAVFPAGLFAKHGCMLYSDNSIPGLSSITGNSDFGYAVINTSWRNIETAKNIYSLTYLQQAIDYVDQNQPGNKVIMFIGWNGFSSAERKVPEYIRTSTHPDFDPAYGSPSGVLVHPATGGEKPKIWNTAVNARIIALYLEILDRYGNNATFAGCGTSETAVGSLGGDYNTANYISGWEDLIDQVGLVYQAADKLWFPSINFIPGSTTASKRALCEYAANKGIGNSPPDLFPQVNLAAADDNYVYMKVMREASQRFGDGRAPIFSQVQALVSKSGGGYYTPDELADYARNQLGSDCILWRRRQDNPDIGNNFTPNVIAAVDDDVTANPYPRPWGTGGPDTSDIAVYQNRVALNTSTGNQVLSHTLGATPFFGMIRTSSATADATLTGTANEGIGFTDGTRQVYLTYRSATGLTVGTQVGNTRGADDAVIGQQTAGSSSLDFEAAHVSWDTDDWTIDITNAPTSANLAHYLLMSGADGSAYVNKLSLTTQDTEATLTCGFEPNLIMVFGGSGAIDDTADSNYNKSFGFATWDGISIDQRGIMQAEVNASNPTAIGSHQSNIYVGGKCSSAGAPTVLYEITEVTATEVKITPRTGDANLDLIVVCLKLDNATLSMFGTSLPTSTGIQSTGVGVIADMVFAISTMISLVNTNYANGQAGAMAFSTLDASAQYCQSFGIYDNRTTTSATRSLTDDKALYMNDHIPISGVSYQADLDSFDGTNMNLNFTAVNSTAGRMFGVAIQFTGADTSQPTTPGQPAVPTTSTDGFSTSWTASTHDLGIQRYKIYLDTVELIVPSPPTTNSIDIRGLGLLPSGTTYNSPGLQISAVGNNGVESALSTARTFSTDSPVDNTDPTFSGIATLVYDQITRIATGTWPTATDNVASASQITYRWYSATTSGGQDFGTPDFETLPGELQAQQADPAEGTLYVVVRAVDNSGNEDTNTTELSVSIPTQSLEYEVAANTYYLDNGSGSIYANTTVNLSYTVNGVSGFMAAAQHYDLADATTDSNGYLPAISLPTSEPGELTIKYESGGVLIGRWLRNVVPTVAA